MSYYRQLKYRLNHRLDGQCLQCPNPARVKANGKRAVHCSDCANLNRQRYAKKKGGNVKSYKRSYQDATANE